MAPEPESPAPDMTPATTDTPSTTTDTSDSSRAKSAPTTERAFSTERALRSLQEAPDIQVIYHENGSGGDKDVVLSISAGGAVQRVRVALHPIDRNGTGRFMVAAKVDHLTSCRYRVSPTEVPEVVIRHAQNY